MSMELYIRIKNGQPYEHPILGDNFRQAFPEIDVDNLPSDFAKFIRIEQPTLGPYEIFVGTTYEWDEGVVKDVHIIREMTLEEKIEKQNRVKDEWAQIGFASWIFNEETCQFDPPTPYPNDDKEYSWNEETLSWIEIN